MRLNLILRLIWALVLATLAAIFTQLIPGLNDSLLIIRVLLTILAALVGFLVFPKIAENISKTTVNFFNFLIKKVSLEVSFQINRLSRQTLSFKREKSSVPTERPVVVDTSAIIDGRILDICKTGFISGTLIIPKFVLSELQLVADSSDDLKRARGRKGFEIIENLKRIKGILVKVSEKEVKGKNVDDKILSLAKELDGRIITTDYNLNRVAFVSNLSVLNINDLSNALKTVAIPGEKLAIKIVHKGKDEGQGVGYLEDGTMVVVTDAAKSAGKSLEVEVTKSLQSPTGRIIFGRLIV